jgi:hypothetical protein
MSEGHLKDTPEELIAHIKQRVDDIDCISINMSYAALRSNEDGTTTELGDVSAVINYVVGRPRIIRRDALEILLDDGVLVNLRLHVRLCLPGSRLTS